MENAHEADLKDLEAQLAQANEREAEIKSLIVNDKALDRSNKDTDSLRQFVVLCLNAIHWRNERVKELEVISDDACSNLMLLTEDKKKLDIQVKAYDYESEKLKENNRRLMEWLKKLEADKEALVAMVEFLKLKNKNLEAETIEKARLYVDSPEFYVLSRERRADAMAEKLRSSNGYN